MWPRSPSALPRSPSAVSRSASALSRSSSRASVSSRRPSISSVRSPTTGAFFICRHEIASSRLNASLSRFPLGPDTLKTKKCFECQTSTVAGTLNLIAAMTRAPDVDKLDPNAVKQAAQFLFERAAAQRRNASFKEQWRAVERAFAAFCYRRLDAARLGDLCHTVRAKFGAGVDRQLLMALAEAACRENKVWEYALDPAGSEAAVYATLNEYVDKLREATALVERFAHVVDMFRNAEALGRLTVETVETLATVDARLPRV